jgi:hypothetical protein
MINRSCSALVDRMIKRLGLAVFSDPKASSSHGWYMCGVT